MSHLISDEAVCRTAPATPGLLTMCHQRFCSYLSHGNAEAGVSGCHKLPSSDRTDGCKLQLWPGKESINRWKPNRAINNKHSEAETQK